MEKENLNYFGKNLKVLLKDKNMSYRELSAKCGVSYQYILNTMSGQRPFNLKLLYSIQQALNLTTLQVCKLVVDDTIETDSEGNKYMMAVLIPLKNVIADDSYGGTIINVYENELINEYGNFLRQQFKDFVAKRLADTYYIEAIEKIATETEHNEQLIEQTKLKMKSNDDFSQIIEMMLSADDNKISYIKDTIKLYLHKH